MGAQEEGRLKGKGKTCTMPGRPPDIDLRRCGVSRKGVEFAYGDAYWIDASDCR